MKTDSLVCDRCGAPEWTCYHQGEMDYHLVSLNDYRLYRGIQVVLILTTLIILAMAVHHVITPPAPPAQMKILV